MKSQEARRLCAPSPNQQAASSYEVERSPHHAKICTSGLGEECHAGHRIPVKLTAFDGQHEHMPEKREVAADRWRSARLYTARLLRVISRLSWVRICRIFCGDITQASTA